jgi:hypothetical protein
MQECRCSDKELAVGNTCQTLQFVHHTGCQAAGDRVIGNDSKKSKYKSWSIGGGNVFLLVYESSDHSPVKINEWRV